MIKTIGFIVFSLLLIILFGNLIHHRVLAAVSNQTVTTLTTTFTIRGGNENDPYDANGKAILKPNQEQGYSVITLDSSLNGRTAELPVGTLVFLHFPTGKHDITINPVKGVVENSQGKYHLPNGDIAILKVVGQGTATITVAVRIPSSKELVTNSATTSGNWSGYARTGTSGSFTDITSNWTVPTASSCSSGDTDSSSWIGIDGDGNSNLIQTGTESGCASGSAYYKAWWEILPAAETVTCTNQIHAGDSMFAEIKKNTSDWTITLKDLTQNLNCSPANQTYSGQQSSAEWILEAPLVSGSQATLTNYGTTSFVNDTQNGGNPNHSYTTDSIDMVVSGTTISTASQPNSNNNGFTTFYCPSTGCPTTYPPGGWTNEGNMSSGQVMQQSVLLPDGKVLIAGGLYTNNLVSTNHTQIYTDGTPGSWASKANMNVDRKYFILQPVTISGGGSRVLAAGGVADSPCSCVRNTAELYNESANTWTNTPNMNAYRYYQASSLLSDGRVLVTGGSNNTAETTQLKSTEIYDPVANTWTPAASMSSVRDNHQQVTFTDSNGNSKVMVIGGLQYVNGTFTRLTSTEIYNPSTDTWSAGPNLSYARGQNISATLLHDGRILVLGGDYPNYTKSEVYNPSTNSWTTYNLPRWGISGSQAALLGSGANYKVLYAGDTNSQGTEAMLFDPSTNSWNITTSMNTARFGLTLMTLTNGNVIAAGGQNNSNITLASSEEYTP